MHSDTFKYKGNMGAAVSTRRNISCPESYGICVAIPHGLFVVSDKKSHQLLMYSLIHGTLIRSIGSEGNGKGQLGNLCVSPDGDSVLVAERDNDRLQEVRLVDGSWVRFVGEGVLKYPQSVDCNGDVIVVSEVVNHRISVLSWADGSLRTRFGNEGHGIGQLMYPMGVRLLADRSGLVVADYSNHRLCVFTLSGKFVAAVGSCKQGVCLPRDVLERVSNGSFIVASWGSEYVTQLSRDGVNAGVFGKYGTDNGYNDGPNALAALPNDGCLVVDPDNRRVQQIAHLQARLTWMRACACRAM
jgi:hypothetical protein